MNKKPPLVSIITVVYNGEKYLEQTIASVLNQTYSNIEYIIIDGGSTDGTLKIIKKHQNQLGKWISEPDKGLYDAMNKGIRMANGELIGMINSDDWYELNAVESMVNAYLANDLKSIFHADRFDVKENGERALRKFHSSSFKFKYYGMTYNHPSMFVTQQEYQKHLYNSELRSHADYQFVLEAYLRNPNIFFYLEKPIVNYRLDGISGNQGMLASIKENYKARIGAKFGIIRTSMAFIFSICASIFLKLWLYLKKVEVIKF